MFRLWRDKGRNHSGYRFAVCLPRRADLPGLRLPRYARAGHPRAQLVCILYRIQGEPKVVEGYELAKLRAPFDDVPRGQWYTNAILWAKLTGIVNGTSATTFDPSGQITREQLAAILYRYTAKYAPDATGNAASLAAYPDAGSVSAYARDAMAWAVGNGLIKGLPHDKTDYLEPGGSTTRAQVATILMRYKQATA